MSIGTSISLYGTEIEQPQKYIRNKGKNLLEFPSEYVVIDIETTGLSPKYDDIIELSALKISDNKIIDEFSTLVKPTATFIDDNLKECYVDDFITELTGITNDMLENAPEFTAVIKQFLTFIGENIIVGHNVNFDINFIYDRTLECVDIKFQNNYCDLLRISRILFPDFDNHKLSTLSKEFGIEQEKAHRGSADCKTTFLCYEYCKSYVIKNNIDLNEKTKKVSLKEMTSNNTHFDTSHPLYHKVCVFTGKLERLSRVDAAQLVLDFGGTCGNTVTKQTNYLILGNNDYCSTIKDGKSSKQKKAERLILSGQDLQIISEDVFYDMILDSNT